MVACPRGPSASGEGSSSCGRLVFALAVLTPGALAGAGEKCGRIHREPSTDARELDDVERGGARQSPSGCVCGDAENDGQFVACASLARHLDADLISECRARRSSRP